MTAWWGRREEGEKKEERVMKSGRIYSMISAKVLSER